MNTLIDVKNVFINFSNHSILSNISLSLTPNRIVTLIGPNGSGKSTLVRVLLGLLKPNRGKIKKVKNLRIGYVPQKLIINTNLPISVYKFMKLFYSVNSKTIIQCLNKVHALHLKNMQLTKLSGGEMQRILLARTLLNSPQLLILDEPTQGIDVTGQVGFYQLIHQLKKELSCSILMVSHDLNLVMARTDEVICLNNHICCSGTPQLVKTHAEFIAMFGAKELQELALYRHNHNGK